MKRVGLFIAFLLVASLFASVLAAVVSAEPVGSNPVYTCAVYFTGEGCPHCAKAKPVIDRVLQDTPGLVLIRYEIYKETENAPLIEQYASSYGVEPGIPLIIFSKNFSLQGDSPIISNLKLTADSLKGNACPLPDGGSVGFAYLNASALPGKPQIISGAGATLVNGTSVDKLLTVPIVIGLALADAFNACVYAMLVLILLAIVTRNPAEKRKVLLSGLAFALAVFVMYFVYGVIILIFFRSLQQYFGAIKPFVTVLISVVAIVLGLINLRDFFSYVPGRAGSEMPIFMRPKVRKIISKVTSPAAAFVAGSIVTLFLIPCTVGPYFILGHILSSLDLLAAVPWLLFYNMIFVLPIIVITVVVYYGYSSVDKVSGWREKNVRYLHLVAGVLLVVVGIFVLLQFVL